MEKLCFTLRMVETGRFGCAVAISLMQANFSAIFRKFGAAVDFTGIDASVVPVYKYRNNNVIGVNGSAFVALASAFGGVFGCCCGTAAGGCCSFVMFFFLLYSASTIRILKTTRSHSIPRKNANDIRKKWWSSAKCECAIFHSHSHSLFLKILMFLILSFVSRFQFLSANKSNRNWKLKTEIKTF